MTKPNPGKVALAIIGGAAGAALVAGGVLSAVMIAGSHGQAAPLAPGLIGYTFAIALLFAATIGFAWHVLVSGRGWTSVHVYLLPGVVVGLMVTAMVLLTPNAQHAGPPGEPYGLVAAPFLIPYGGIVGALTGSIAWLIRRPDKANPAKPAS